MPPRKIEVRSPARLHLGLFSFGNVGRQYGGVGVMVDQPAVHVRLCAAEQFELSGTHTDCAASAARCWADATTDSTLPACHISVLSAPPRHVGLGSGTQLALSVAAGLQAWHQLPEPTATELASLTGRGQRSAVGTYGFALGGLIVEMGKLPEEKLAPLHQRLAFPDAWRFVLARLGGPAGLHGPSERRAFRELPPVTPETRAALEAEVNENLIPALQREDCASFGESLYRYGYRAGDCFAAVQGGPYNGQHVADLVSEIRSMGISGVAQSSWGPTLFCLLANQREAISFADELKQRHAGEDLDVCVTAADNQGAEVVLE